MKVVAFNGSPREDGNTSLLLKEVLSAISLEGIETELVQVGGKNIRGCIACYNCFKNKDRECSVKSDMANTFIKKAFEADAIIIGSPTYFADLTADTKALIDRMGFVSLANDGVLRRRIGAAVVAVRRAGAVHVFDSINHMFLMNGMLVAGSTYWNIGFGRNKGEVAGDEEGLRNMKDLGANIAWLLKKIKG